MATDQVTVTRESLHEEFRRDAMQTGLVVAASWLWAIFSFFTSTSAGTWFARSGSVMCLIGAAGAFKLINDYNRALATAVEHGVTQSRRVELVLDPPKLNRNGRAPGGGGAGMSGPSRVGSVTQARTEWCRRRTKWKQSGWA